MKTDEALRTLFTHYVVRNRALWDPSRMPRWWYFTSACLAAAALSGWMLFWMSP